MIEQFKGISESQFEQLKNAVSLITVLIAGADGNIDRKEKEWAEKVTNIRSYSLPDGLKDFYLEVGQDFQNRLDAYIDQYAGDADKRNREISAELSKLNNVFPKLEDRETAIALYESFISFARHVARASGGFLSWGSINVQEKKLMSLEMIDPVES
ncbi:MAG: hypothetical protein KDC53_16185 [Saprospiraceae bacterium]|nr:hypothetical protein [Saprospiraceae bacterium]